MLAAALVCLLLGAPAIGAAPAAQPDPGTRPILLTDPVPDPRQEGVLYFLQTGHTLRGPFLRYWQEHGGLAQFGYPLTEEFFEPSGPDNAPLQVQYFERNRFELHPENAGTPHEVLLGALGREFRPQDPPAPQQADAMYFPETGHNLSGKFRAYWEAHGGLTVHGYPITEAAMERSTNGKDYLVQWFERSRFELHPENAGSEHEVLLGLLGRQLSEKKGYPYGWYPAFGRAVDWSWVAGMVRLYDPNPNCDAASCGCVLLRYEANSQTTAQAVAIEDPRRPYFFPLQPHDEYSYGRGRGDASILYGRKLQPSEAFLECLWDPSAIGYATSMLQDNPAR
jgi:hypothetical protein